MRAWLFPILTVGMLTSAPVFAGELNGQNEFWKLVNKVRERNARIVKSGLASGDLALEAKGALNLPTSGTGQTTCVRSLVVANTGALNTRECIDVKITTGDVENWLGEGKHAIAAVSGVSQVFGYAVNKQGMGIIYNSAGEVASVFYDQKTGLVKEMVFFANADSVK